MKILVVPTTDWLKPNNLTRLHHIFKRIAIKHDVHVIRFNFGKGKLIVNNNEKILTTRKIKLLSLSEWPPTYYIIHYISNYYDIDYILKKYDFDIIIGSNFQPVKITFKKSKKSIKKIFDLSDHFPLAGVEYLPRHNFIRLPFKFYFENILKSIILMTDSTVVSSFPLNKYANYLGAKETKIISNGVDDIFLELPYTNEIREKYKLSGYITLGFVGAIRNYYNMTCFLRAIKYLYKEIPLKLMILGPKQNSQEIYNFYSLIKQFNLNHNIIWPSYLPFNEVPKYIDAMDICVIPLDISQNITHYLAPNKLWEYLSRGKTVITAPIPNVVIQAKQYINTAKNTNEYVEIIKNYYDDPEYFIKKGKLGKYVAKNHSWSNIAATYQTYLENML